MDYSHQNFEVKLYFNVGIDDKFGFEPETDWIKVIKVIGVDRTIDVVRQKGQK